MIDGVVLRRVRPGDAGAMAEIYAHHVRHGTASFDTVPRTEVEMRERIASCISRRWPFLVAERKGEVLCYCYATPFRERPAYANTCENSIYVRQDDMGQGIGKALLAALVVESTQFGFRQMIAVVGGGEPSSVGMHQSLGFREAGRIRSVGRKFGKWLDTVYLQLALGAGDSVPPVHEP